MTDTLSDELQSRKEQEDWLRDNIHRAEWRDHGDDYPGLLELYIDDTMLAWINERPHYCDRGHYQAQIEFSPGNPLDAADGMPCYYMRLEVAKQEIHDKLMWRVCKVRAT
jgi:hypothetical protein